MQKMINDNIKKILDKELKPMRRRDRFLSWLGICSKREMDNFSIIVDYTFKHVAKFMNYSTDFDAEINMFMNQMGYRKDDNLTKGMIQ